MASSFISNSVEETQNIALELMPLILSSKIVLLKGDLGSGKTVISRAIIRLLCNDPHMIITSPTFNILKTYQSTKFDLIAHYDLYRVKSLLEIEEIGLLEIINTQQNITLIEWPEIITPLINQYLLTITLEHNPDNESRIIKVDYPPITQK